MLCIKLCKRWFKKEKSPFQEFTDQLETQHKEKKDVTLKEKLLTDHLESITIIV